MPCAALAALAALPRASASYGAGAAAAGAGTAAGTAAGESERLPRPGELERLFLAEPEGVPPPPPSHAAGGPQRLFLAEPGLLPWPKDAAEAEEVRPMPLGRGDAEADGEPWLA